MRNYLLFVFITFYCTAFAQDWALINSYDHYNYKAADSALITNVIFADSFKVNGTDTTYYLNRVCLIGAPDTMVTGAMHFLETEVQRTANGVYIFNGDSSYPIFNTDGFVLFTQADSGFSWTYDTVANITATVTKKYVQAVLGVPDSLKQINLSTGDSITISKSLGIVSFPRDSFHTSNHSSQYFNLQGIPTRGLGDSVISFNDVYNFNIGDVFMYYITESSIGGEVDEHLKRTVVSKQFNGDSIVYVMHEIWSAIYLPNDGYSPGPPSGVDTEAYIYYDSLNHFANSFPGDFVSPLYGALLSSGTDYSPYGGAYSGNSFCSYTIDTPFNLSCKSLINSFLPTGQPKTYFEIGSQQAYVYKCSICAGVGDAYFNYFDFEGGWSEQLIGYIKNGIQYGTVSTDQEILATNDAVKPKAIFIYPNPANEFAHIVTSNPQPSMFFTLYDLEGRLIDQFNLTATVNTINCKLLSPAMYLWHVTDKQGNILSSGKLIKCFN